MINFPGGKLFEAPNKLIPESECAWQMSADMRLKSIKGERINLMNDLITLHPATLLTISYSGFADPMVDSFREPFLAHQKTLRCGLIDLRPVPSRIKHLLWSPFAKWNASKAVPEDMQHAYFIYRGGRELREMLGVPNLFGGYAYLLDRAGRVRWRASGMAAEWELDTMFTCIQQISKQESKPQH